MENQIPIEEEKSKTKLVAIILLLLLLLGVVGVYFSGGSLKSYIFGSSTEEGEKVGIVKAVTGVLKRQPKDSLEFLEVSINADLFNEDTVMTGPSDRATLELFDGSILELDPGSLIRLSFEKEAGVTGIQRRVLVDIVAGNIKGDLSRPKLVIRRGGQPIAKPTPEPIRSVAPVPIEQPTPSLSPSPEPSPSPTPTPSPSMASIREDKIRVSQPKVNEEFTLPIGQTPPLKQALIFESPSLPKVEVLMILKNSNGKEVLRRKVKAVNGRGGLIANFERPGNYRIELRNIDNTKIGRGILVPFSVRSEFEAIETEAPLVGGEAIDSNRFMGKRLKDFDVVLRWKPVQGIEKYNVLVFDQAGKTLVDQPVTGVNYAFPKAKVYTDPINYQIRANLSNGYTALSKKQGFIFNFVSPIQTLPKNDEVIALSDPEIIKQKGILFSWQRTTFTDFYEFEIAGDPEFRRILKKVTIKQSDNFLIFKNLKPLTYWWRVRASAGTMKSMGNQGFKMTVTP